MLRLGQQPNVASRVCLLDAIGTHNLLTMGQFGNNSGPYGLYLQRTSNPLNATTAAYGEEQTVSIAAGQVEDYTFDGVINDSVLITLSSASALNP